MHRGPQSSRRLHGHDSLLSLSLLQLDAREAGLAAWRAEMLAWQADLNGREAELRQKACPGEFPALPGLAAL